MTHLSNQNIYKYNIVDGYTHQYLTSLEKLIIDRFSASFVAAIFFDGENYLVSPNQHTEILLEDVKEIYNLNILTTTATTSGNHLITTEVKTESNEKIGVLVVGFFEKRTLTDAEFLTLTQYVSLVAMFCTQRAETRKIATIETEMLHRIVHDFKNPSMSISLAAEVIGKKQNDPKIVATFADKIKNACERLVKQVDRIYDFASSGATSFRPNFSDFNIYELFLKLKEAFDSTSTQQIQHLQFENSNLIINADYDRLYETLYELTNNALRFSDQNIQLKASEEADHYQISIEDQGPGMSDDELEEAFKKYGKRKNNATLSRGFGLAMVKTLVHLQKGELQVESRKERGTLFTLKLPKL